MARFVKWTRSEVTPINFWHTAAFRIRFEIVEAVDIDPNVFVYHRRPADPRSPPETPLDDFQAVCGPHDMEAWPVANPLPEDPNGFFRLDYVDLLLPSIEMAQQLRSEIPDEICRLIAALNSLDTLSVVEEASCGVAPAESESSESL